jgi:hypothetical protein
MKNSALPTTLLVLWSLTILIPAAGAAPNDDHDDAQVESSAIAIPESREELWEVIQAEHTSLLKAVEAGSDGGVHQSEGKLQVYLKALPEKLADVEDGVRQRIEGQVRNLARAYDAVHRAVDDKAWENAAAEMRKAEGGMKLLATQMTK